MRVRECSPTVVNAIDAADHLICLNFLLRSLSLACARALYVSGVGSVSSRGASDTRNLSWAHVGPQRPRRLVAPLVDSLKSQLATKLSI